MRANGTSIGRVGRFSARSGSRFHAGCPGWSLDDDKGDFAFAAQPPMATTTAIMICTSEPGLMSEAKPMSSSFLVSSRMAK